ncbi:M15 family metallopeptidase [Sphingomonas sp. PAMC 26621]|uniref:M15 family metallopeptidase n=1 Tax=Sphingomonas sp. PAMC 26621 TaxID=1112213 RepID=UPI00031B103D|nr:M15 family metallopeptidase [Sphingomonas sp. PAMC 26621]
MQGLKSTILTIIVLLPGVAGAAPLQPLPMPSADGRLFGHLPYGDIAALDLVPAPPGFSIGATCRINRDAAADLARLLVAAADTPGVGTSLRAVSCYRGVAHQQSVFCRERHRTTCVDPSDRARSVAPPGYSEHATGYAIDFGVRPTRGCPDVDYCFASTPAGQWLMAHGPEFGFELSFPAANRQGVTWEPWHWRWVGTRVEEPGAAVARLLFARARNMYPALPAARDVLDANAAAVAMPAGRIETVRAKLPDITGVRARRR